MTIWTDQSITFAFLGAAMRVVGFTTILVMTPEIISIVLIGEARWTMEG
jgi:hypothetical protein